MGLEIYKRGQGTYTRLGTGLAGAAMAAEPYIVCNPQEGVIGYQITGAPAGVFPENIAAWTDGSIKFNVLGIPDGTYTLKVAACNMWGCGEPADLGFTKARPARPAGLKIGVQ